jgi:hypothetical protein
VDDDVDIVDDKSDVIINLVSGGSRDDTTSSSNKV